MKVKPNLFIVGAAKCGTTSLYTILSKHPDVYMSKVKEPHFFSDVESTNRLAYEEPKKDVYYHTRIVKAEAVYHQLFENGRDFRYRGEASPSYLWDKNAAKRIFDYNPAAKIIIILRHPSERAFSHYQMGYNAGRIKESDFLSGVQQDYKNNDKRWGGNCHLYLELGLYSEQIKIYLDIFPKKQVKILLFDDLKNRPEYFLQEVFSFLDLDLLNIESIEKSNAAKNIRPTLLKRFLKNNLFFMKIVAFLPSFAKQKLKSYGAKKVEPLIFTEEARQYLDNFYADELFALEKLGVSFSARKIQN